MAPAGSDPPATRTTAHPDRRGGTAAGASRPRRQNPAIQERLSLAAVLQMLEQAGTDQTKRTYLRHGATEPLFGVLFAELEELRKRIGIDHELAMALWETGNFDARNLAFKIVDPTRVTAGDLERWVQDMTVRMCAGYVSVLAAETPFGLAKAREWLAARDESRRCAGWMLVGQLALRAPEVPESWLLERLADLELGLHEAPNDERYARNHALIALASRSLAMQTAALAAARRLGEVHVDHGDTHCQTPDAEAAIASQWARAVAKGFATPALQEQRRRSPRTRC